MLDIQSHKNTNFKIIRGYESAINNSITGVGFGGSAIINTVEEPEPVYVVSSSANDTVGGTGATEITIVLEQTVPGCEDCDVEITPEIRVEMSGTSEVPIDQYATGVVSFTVTGTGSGNTNAGTLSLKTTDTDSVLYTIPTGVGQSKSSLTTISRRSKLKQLNVYTDATTTSNVPELYEIAIRTTTETNSGEFASTTAGNILATFFATPGKNEFELYDVLSSGTKVWCTAKNVTNSNSNAVSTELIYYGY